MSKLLTTNNHKTIKSLGLGWITYILYMSPYNRNSKGINLCPFASRGCAAACLVDSGLGGIYKTVKDARLNRTEFYLSDRQAFLNQIDKEITAAKKKHAGKAILTIRLNGTSDISYEKLKVRDGKTIFELHNDVQFYDYTKNYLRFDKVLPANYHLTFSKSEDNTDKALELLSRGENVAIVFEGKVLPDSYMGYKVISGDETDLRHLDPKGVIVGLTYKMNTGKGANNKGNMLSGFVVTKEEVRLAA